MLRLTTTATLGLGLCLPLAAQNPIAYPQGSLLTSNGNFIPFGYSQLNKSYSEGRFQQLIPATHLPSNPSVVTSLEFAVSGGGNRAVTYKSLKITMSNTTITRLSTTFANNLSNPQVVYDKQNVSLPWPAGMWVRIDLTTPMLFDASGGIVLEIQKVVDESVQTTSILTHLTLADPYRPDLPQQVYSFGTFGSGTSTSATSRFGSVYPLELRLITSGPTLSVTSDPGGSSTPKNCFAVGGSLQLDSHGSPGGAYQNLLSLGFTGSPLPFLGGRIYLGSPLLFVDAGQLDTTGTRSRTYPIPQLASLVGAHIAIQGVSGPAFRLTNAVDFVVNK